MTAQNAFNIFVNVIIWAAIITLIIWIVDQVFGNPLVNKWVKIVGAVLLLFVLIGFVTGGVTYYPFFK